MRLSDLADVLRRAGLEVVEVDGWKTRGRRTDGGEYTNGRPTAVMVHHTASRAGTPAANDVQYMTFNSSIAPLANLYIERGNGRVWVMAAGPTNTNGSGTDTWGGGVADNNMNRHAIGIEIGNDGVGEWYSRSQQAAVVKTCAALCEHYGISVNHVRAHHEWAPGRKIDPSGPSDWAAMGKWDMPSFRLDVAKATLGGNVSSEFEIINPPVRALDSRMFGDEAGRVGSARPGDNGQRTIELPGAGSAIGASVTITAVSTRGAGFATVWGSGGKPNASVLNWDDGTAAIANTTTTPLAAGGMKVFIHGDAHLIIDVHGYYRR